MVIFADGHDAVINIHINSLAECSCVASGHDGLKVGRLGQLGRAHNDGCFMQNDSLAEVAIAVVHLQLGWES